MSTQPYGKFSGMNTTPLTVNTIGTTPAGTKVFAKVLVTAEVGQAIASEGDIFRSVKNASAALTIYLAETIANASAANGYPLAPGEALTILGPSGSGWKGDMFAVASGDGATLAVIQF